jgi:hypothetical protein
MPDELEAVERHVSALEGAAERLADSAASPSEATAILREMAEEAAALSAEVERARRTIVEHGV